MFNTSKNINFAQVKLGFAEDVFRIFAKDKFRMVSGYIIYKTKPSRTQIHPRPLTLNRLGEFPPPFSIFTPSLGSPSFGLLN